MDSLSERIHTELEYLLTDTDWGTPVHATLNQEDESYTYTQLRREGSPRTHTFSPEIQSVLSQAVTEIQQRVTIDENVSPTETTKIHWEGEGIGSRLMQAFDTLATHHGWTEMDIWIGNADDDRTAAFLDKHNFDYSRNEPDDAHGETFTGTREI